MNNTRPAVRPLIAPVRVSFICTGNICRSPMAEVVFADLVYRAGLRESIISDSAGTGGWHVGDAADERAVRTLAAHGYDGSTHRAQQISSDWFLDRDLLIALDRSHERALRSMAPPDRADRIYLLSQFGSPGDPDVADPYYDGIDAFEEVLDQVEDSCAGLLEWIQTGMTNGTAHGTG